MWKLIKALGKATVLCSFHCVTPFLKYASVAVTFIVELSLVRHPSKVKLLIWSHL